MARVRTNANREADKRYNAKRAGKRSRGWACVVYPESAPSAWVENLREGHIQTLISPLHDKDTTADGEIKKAHYHVMVMFENPEPEKTAAEYFARAGVTAPPEQLKSIRGYARYLVHMDDHDKHCYSAGDVTTLSGAVWATAALDEAEAEEKLLNDIEQWIDDTGCVSYHGLCVYARNQCPEWTRIIRHRTIHLKAYVQSLMWDISQIPQKATPQEANSETGKTIKGNIMAKAKAKVNREADDNAILSEIDAYRESDDILLDEIISWIAETKCVSFGVLYDYARTKRPNWKRVTQRKTIFLTNLIKSYAWKLEQSRQ